MNVALFLPELILSGLALLFLCLMLAKEQINEKVLEGILLTGALFLLWGSLYSLSQSGSLFFNTYRIDLFSQGFKSILSLAFLVTVLLSNEWNPIPKNRVLEHHLFLVTATLGMMMMVSAVDVLSLFVSLELSAYSLYLLAALKTGHRNAESSVKYLLFGATVSGVSLWGLSLVVGLSGTTSIPLIIKSAVILGSNPAFILGISLFSLSLLFKLSSFPLQFWAPDVYESASIPAVNMIATGSKAAAVAVLIHVLMLSSAPAALLTVLGVLAFVSMTLGNTVALVQTDVKRILAYSSIAQAGYILVGLLSGSLDGFSTAYFYAFAYVVMNSGAFLVVTLLAKETGTDNPQVSHFDGLAERSPFLALLLLLSLLSLAGIPPLVGFTSKWFLFTASMQKGHWFLVLWAVLNSVVSLFYYLNLVKHAYMGKSKNSSPIILSDSVKILGFCLLAALLLIGIFPSYFVTFSNLAIAEKIL